MFINKKNLPWIGTYFLLDGLLAFLFGLSYFRLYRIGKRSTNYNKAIELLLERPSWQLRGSGALEAGFGLAILTIKRKIDL